MNWLALVAYFFGGLFAANAVPHWVAGLMGRSFQTPFAKPPGKGLSSPTVNVLWSFSNVVFSYLLTAGVGAFHLRDASDVIAFGTRCAGDQPPTGTSLRSALSRRCTFHVHEGRKLRYIPVPPELITSACGRAALWVSNVGTWMQRVAQDWLVLTQLTHHDATALGIVMALQFAPQLLLLPWTGLAADRLNQRRLLMVNPGHDGPPGLSFRALLPWRAQSSFGRSTCWPSCQAPPQLWTPRSVRRLWRRWSVMRTCRMLSP